MKIEEFTAFLHKVADDFAMGVRDEGNHEDEVSPEAWLIAVVHEATEQIWEGKHEVTKGTG